MYLFCHCTRFFKAHWKWIVEVIFIRLYLYIILSVNPLDFLSPKKEAIEGRREGARAEMTKQ